MFRANGTCQAGAGASFVSLPLLIAACPEVVQFGPFQTQKVLQPRVRVSTGLPVDHPLWSLDAEVQAIQLSPFQPALAVASWLHQFHLTPRYRQAMFTITFP